MQTGSPSGPVVIYTAAWDDVFGYRAMTDALPDDVRVLAVSAADLPPGEVVSTIDALSALFEEALVGVAADDLSRPLTLLGWSTAGVVAYDLADRLTRRGCVVERVAMVDTYFPGEEQHLWSNRWWKYKSLATPSAFAGEVKKFATRRSQAVAKKVGTRLLRYAGTDVPAGPERTSVGGVPLEAFTYRPASSRIPVLLYAASTTNPDRTYRAWRRVAEVEVVPVEGRHRGYLSIMGADRVHHITDDLTHRLHPTTL